MASLYNRVTRQANTIVLAQRNKQYCLDDKTSYTCMNRYESIYRNHVLYYLYFFNFNTWKYILWYAKAKALVYYDIYSLWYIKIINFRNRWKFFIHFYRLLEFIIIIFRSKIKNIIWTKTREHLINRIAYI